MKNKFLNFLSFIAISASLNAQDPSVKTEGNQRAAAPIVLTTSQRQAIAASNQVAVVAAGNYNASISTAPESSVATGGNPRSSAPIIITKSSRDGVNLFSVDGAVCAYGRANNAFIPVKSRNQAIRVATGTFEPVSDEAGKRLKSRRANPKGENAEVILGVTENRSKVKTQESEEEELSN